jgi:hypothetical protein
MTTEQLLKHMQEMNKKANDQQTKPIAKKRKK